MNSAQGTPISNRPLNRDTNATSGTIKPEEETTDVVQPLERLNKRRVSQGLRIKSYSFVEPLAPAPPRVLSKKLSGSAELQNVIREETVSMPVEAKKTFMRTNEVKPKSTIARLQKVATIEPVNKTFRDRFNKIPKVKSVDDVVYCMVQLGFMTLAMLFSYELSQIPRNLFWFLGSEVLVMALMIISFPTKFKNYLLTFGHFAFGVMLNLGVYFPTRNVYSLALAASCMFHYFQSQWNKSLFKYLPVLVLSWVVSRAIRAFTNLCYTPLGCEVNLTNAMEDLVTFLLFSALAVGMALTPHAVDSEYFNKLIAKLGDLIKDNLDLQHQLREANINIQTDITAPLTAATQLLVSISKDPLLTQSAKREIVQILEMLNADKLFQPDIFLDTGDVDLTNYLQDVLQTRKTIFLTPTVKARAQAAKSSPKQTTAAKILKELEQMGDPFFDCIHLEVVAEGHSLFYLGVAIYQENNFQSTLGINEKMFKHWLYKMESGYDRKNPYHNALHAADVLHSMNHFINQKQLRDILNPEQLFACVVAAVGHDYMHPGFTNAFLVATKNPLALRYNDISVLENFHAASVKEIFLQAEFNLLANLTPEQQLEIRELITSMILATDIGFHFEWLNKFKAKVSSNSFNFENLNDKKLVLNMAIKCADVNNLTKPLHLSRKWTQLILDEFFIQGDQERERGLPISMFMDRNNTDIPKCQMGFIDYIVFPLYDAWKSYFVSGEIDQHVINIQNNKKFWKSVSDNHTPVERIEMPEVKVSVLKLHRPAGKQHSADEAADAHRRESDENVERAGGHKGGLEKRAFTFFKGKKRTSVTPQVVITSSNVLNSTVEMEAKSAGTNSMSLKYQSLEGKGANSLHTDSIPMTQTHDMAKSLDIILKPDEERSPRVSQTGRLAPIQRPNSGEP